MSWSTAYAVQARCDLLAMEHLSYAGIPACQSLHFLQMAAEKLCKAHLASQGVEPDVLQSSHAFTAKQLPMTARQILGRAPERMPGNNWIIAAIRTIARQIELLHPQVNDGGAMPANCEYPWVGPAGEIIAPAEYAFGLDLLYERAGVTLVKIMRIAADDLIEQG